MDRSSSIPNVQPIERRHQECTVSAPFSFPLACRGFKISGHREIQFTLMHVIRREVQEEDSCFAQLISGLVDPTQALMGGLYYCGGIRRGPQQGTIALFANFGPGLNGEVWANTCTCAATLC